MYIINTDYNPIIMNNWYGFKLMRLDRYKWLRNLHFTHKRGFFCPTPCPSCIARFIVTRLLKKFVRIWKDKRRYNFKDVNYRQVHGKFKRLRIY